MSGQKVSGSKSRVYFSRNVPPNLTSELSTNLGIATTRDLGRYLSVPVLHNRITKETYSYLVDKVHSRLAGWKAKQLSMAGQITLIRSVLALIPTYTMQTIHLPASICDSLDKINRGFVWGDSKERKRIHLVRWEEICKPKKWGRLGLQSAYEMNKSLLAKLGWQFLTEPDAAWVRVLEAKYCRLLPRRIGSHPNMKKSVL